MTWDAGSLASVLSVPIDNVGVYSSDVSNDGRAIVTGGQAGPRLWDIATGNPLGPALTGLNGLAGTVDLSSDGSAVVGADESGDVLLWDVATGAIMGDPLPGPGPDDKTGSPHTSRQAAATSWSFRKPVPDGCGM
jgi:WD40 repeat protein